MLLKFWRQTRVQEIRKGGGEGGQPLCPLTGKGGQGGYGDAKKKNFLIYFGAPFRNVPTRKTSAQKFWSI